MKRVPYMMNISKVQADLIDAFVASNPNQDSFERAELFKFAEEQGFSGSAAYTLMKQMPRVARGVYQMVGSGNVIQMNAPLAAPVAVPQVEQTPIAKAVAKVQSTSSEEVYIPSADPTFVKWGYFADVLKIVKSNMFYPMYVAGLSGNGKTMMIEQACANAKREYVRVQITPETDEDDLIGGFRLLDGETVFAKGPVIKAMEAGAILLIDEIDRGSNKLMCLQGVLEGKPVLIKKTGEVIQPAPGFNVIATANTKGRGSDDGKFMGAQILDEAFLERVAITIEQEYPSAAQEKKIVLNKMAVQDCVDVEFAENLVTWADVIRKTFYEGAIDELVSTRRLEHIVKAFAMFNDRLKAIQLCVNRFDTDTKTAFIDLYTKVDAGVDLDTPAEMEVIDEE